VGKFATYQKRGRGEVRSGFPLEPPRHWDSIDDDNQLEAAVNEAFPVGAFLCGFEYSLDQVTWWPLASIAIPFQWFGLGDDQAPDPVYIHAAWRGPAPGFPLVSAWSAPQFVPVG
jgi:hypothetical protein